VLIAAAALRQTERQMPQHTKIDAALLPAKMAAVVRMRWWTLHSPAIRKTRHKYRETRHKFLGRGAALAAAQAVIRVRMHEV
jgi:hypothetical protein